MINKCIKQNIKIYLLNIVGIFFILLNFKILLLKKNSAASAARTTEQNFRKPNAYG